MNELTTITTKGQVTIPQIIRRQFGAKVGDKVAFDQILPDKKQIVIRIIPQDIVNQIYGSLNSPVKFTKLPIVRQKAKKLLAKKYSLK